MSFAGELEAITGTAADAYDIRAAVRRCYFYDFDGYAVRLWDGHGVLYAGGYEWLGTLDAMDQNRHVTPTIRDARDGTSPRYEFSLPYLDETTFRALKVDQSRAAGRDLTCYHVLCKVEDGLRPTTELRFAYRLAMKGVQFSEQWDGELADKTLVRTATVIAKSLEYGRSRVPAGTMTDTAQNDRARVLGLASDSGCSFVAANSVRTYTIKGG